MAGNIIAVVDDLMFASKIRGTAEHVGVAVAFPRSADGVAEVIQRDAPSLIICDLHSQKINPMELATRLKANDQTRNVPLVGFFSHVHIELQAQAEAAGFDRVMPRSSFARNLAEILQGAG